jgi:hypothetical protein
MERKKERSLRTIPINRYPFTPVTYPGRRPRFSFFFTQRGIYRVKLRTLGRLLANRGLPPPCKRYAILAYGSNACPEQLQKKKLTDVPVLFGRISGAEAVYAHRQTKGGYVPATLARKKGGRSTWVTLLTQEQLSTMDASEGRPNSYELTEFKNVEFSIHGSTITPLYGYVDVVGGVMTLNGRPASLRTTSQKRAKSLLATASGEDAANWLDYVTIPHPNHPQDFSQILRRGPEHAAN